MHRPRPTHPRRVLPLLALAAMPVQHALATATATDASPLTQAERRLFLPLVCTNAKLERGTRPIYENRCATLPGYMAHGRTVNTTVLEISLTSIIRGSMTAPGKTEAYITYRGSFESHATLNGGGILVRRAGQIWQIIGWYPAEKRDGCLALPHTMPLEMLCQDSDGHAASSAQGVGISATPPLQQGAQPRITLSQAVGVLHDNTYDTCQEAHDPARLSNVQDPCSYRRPGRGFLLNLGQPKRSHAPGIFAELPVTYATPENVKKACEDQCFLDRPEKSGTIIFRLHANRITVEMPVPMEDYIYR